MELVEYVVTWSSLVVRRRRYRRLAVHAYGNLLHTSLSSLSQALSQLDAMRS